MSVKKNRRLAAIMFTDIVGYTQLMQESESQAAKIRARHREIFEHFHAEYKGTILQYYGDGTLSIFDSSVNAAKCAIAIQQDLQLAPIVPLRIGIHSGDIVIDDKDVYGDGVNVASRVESLGVSGSILISEDVQKHIKNQAIETISMGLFEMKNVAIPMNVYAIKAPSVLVPRRNQLKGKAKQVKSSPSFLNQRRGRFMGIGILAILLATILFWAFGQSKIGQNNLLSEEIRENKVAVAIFENFTNDPELDALGFLASEWITSSLREIGVKTVAPEIVRQYKDYVGIIPKNPEGKVSFSELTEAKYIVSGSYFAKGDSIRLNTRLLDAITGKEVQAFPVLWKKKNEKESLVEEARQRLMGYWAIEKNQHFPRINPPAYKAYQKFLECTPGQYNCYLDVLAKDSTFILAHVSLMSSVTWTDFDSLFFASKSYVEKHLDRCTQYEKNYYRHAIAFWEGNFKQTFEHYEANYQLDTMNIIMLHQSSYSAAAYLNRPDIALKRYSRLFSDYETFREHAWSGPFYHYADALNRTGGSDKLIEFVQKLPEGEWRKNGANWGWFELYLAYLNTGQPEKAQSYIDTIHQWEPSDNFYSRAAVYSRAAAIWSTFYQDTIPNPFHNQIRNNINNYKNFENVSAQELWNFSNEGAPFGIKEYQSYLLQDWTDAKRQIFQLKANPPSFINPSEERFEEFNRGVFDLWLEGMLGNIYARQGKRKLAIQQLELLDNLKETFPKKHAPILRGIIPYYQARIHALLGNKDEAVSYLQQALKEGKPIFGMSFRIDYDLASLRGYAPYEKLTKPLED